MLFSSRIFLCLQCRIVNRFQINIVGLAAIDNPAGRMGNSTNIRIRQGIHNSFSDLLARLLLTEMHTGDNPISLTQTIVVDVETPAASRMSTSTPLSTVMPFTFSLSLSICSHCRRNRSAFIPLATLTRGE